MDSYALFKFAVRKDFDNQGTPQQRLYQFEISPGSPYEEILASLDEFKVAFLDLQEKGKAEEAAQAAKKADELAQPEPEVLEAEVVA